MDAVHPEADVAAAPPARETRGDASALRDKLHSNLLLATGKDPAHGKSRDWLYAVAGVAREALAARWVESRRIQRRWSSKRVCYLSMEFLLGRMLMENLRNLDLGRDCRAVLAAAGHDLDDIAEYEADAGLGNGGLGRLAACLMDSLTTQGIAARGYGIRYEYGMFAQHLDRGWQVEKPDHWLRHGNPWEFPRADIVHAVPFFGRVVEQAGPEGRQVRRWIDTQDVFAMAYDVPISGYGTKWVNAVRLWSPKAQREFDLASFNDGDHVRAVENRARSENLARVLYPDDSTEAGRELRFMQQYFFASASMQDVICQLLASGAPLDHLPDKAAIAINDTHPAIVVAELMRLLIDGHGFDWESAWDIVRRTVCYTNHTLMPEALETWPVRYFERMLPRHLEIIYGINARFLASVEPSQQARVSLVGESGERRIRMAHLAFVGSHRVNGVSAVHTGLLKSTVFADLHRLFPDKITNVTNGVTPRRWLAQANPPLATLVSARIGPDWQRRLERLGDIAGLAEDTAFRDQFRAIKQGNKARLAHYVARLSGQHLDTAALFDVHIKRIHEYKRQLLNVLHVVDLYNRLRRGESVMADSRCVIFGGKAAPGYAMAKLIVKLIHDVAATVNVDPAVKGRLQVVFLPNYGVSLAEKIIPAADLSQQISTAGTEASGTGNMKLALNGALTIGTLDGANIEIAEAVGRDNMFLFGLDVGQAAALRAGGYAPRSLYAGNGALREALDMIGDGYFSPDEPDRYRPILRGLLDGGDRYLVLADFDAYCAAQRRAEALFADRDAWARRAILNVAHMGGLSSDRAIADYAERVWHVTPVS
ncbi:MAG: glycogen/starch/alpha-glucan phosphorylase [Alphaproteobacteria bacterium]|nr:glycogen/starch/alpha-glucan phosphorylase [Alphaproteobacteria bacterium]